jgi:hypothetical protein
MRLPEPLNRYFLLLKTLKRPSKKLIQTKTIAALSTVTSGSTFLHYLFDPMIHHSLSRAPTTIISNYSNKKGEFSLIKIKIASFQLSPTLHPKGTLTPF